MYIYVSKPGQQLKPVNYIHNSVFSFIWENNIMIYTARSNDGEI